MARSVTSSLREKMAEQLVGAGVRVTVVTEPSLCGHNVGRVNVVDRYDDAARGKLDGFQPD